MSVNILNRTNVEIVQTYNLEDVGAMVEEFLDRNQEIIHSKWLRFSPSSQLGFDAFLEELKPKLANSCIRFINSNLDFSVLNSYLFPTVFETIKLQSSLKNKKIAIPICPACKFFNFEQELIDGKFYKCPRCIEGLNKNNLSIQEYKLLSMFSEHSKTGFKCNDCARFIAQPFDGSKVISCPYFDCYFSGEIANLKKIRHPFLMRSPMIYSIDAKISNCSNESNLTGLSVLADKNILPDSSIEIEREISNHRNLILDTIESQLNSLYYSTDSATFMHKKCVYEAYKLFLNKFPDQMITYLIFLKKNVGLQNDLFKEYILLLEKQLPYSFKKNGKKYIVSSLLDKELLLFDGISTFTTKVEDNLQIKNATKEFYIGGRLASYTKPYWIGKLLDVIDENKKSILVNVIDYSFTKIKLQGIKPNSMATVIHLRCPPHYQMGGMVYINRIRRKLVDRIYFILNGKKRET